MNIDLRERRLTKGEGFREQPERRRPEVAGGGGLVAMWRWVREGLV